MNKEIFVNYRSFSNREELEHVIQLLELNHVDCLAEDNTIQLNPYERNKELNLEFHLKLKQADFSKADKIITNSFLADLDQLPADYYLYSFTDKELIEILTKPDEWNLLDYELAKKLLRSKGKVYDEELLETLKMNRLEEHNKPEASQTTWIAAGYILALLGGFFGMLIGYVIYSHKKTLPDGSRINGYNENDRLHGKRLMYLGLACWITYVFIYLEGVN